jgi:hypothetical protein
MNMQLCPVCAGKAICATRRFSDPVPVIPSPLSVSCEQCGPFTAVEGFFPSEWDTIPLEDKPALAAYLKGTKRSPYYVRTLSPESWRRMVHQGREWLMTPASRARAY